MDILISVVIRQITGNYLRVVYQTGNIIIFTPPMEKGSFNDIISRFGELSEKEGKEILAELDNYPYSQVLNVLMARILRDTQSPDRQLYLNRAAIYVCDRKVLKDVMTAPCLSKIKTVDSNPEKAVNEPEKPGKTEDTGKSTFAKEEILNPNKTPKEQPAPVETIKKAKAPPPQTADTNAGSYAKAKASVNTGGPKAGSATGKTDDEYFSTIQKDLEDLDRSKKTYEEVASRVNPEEWKEEQEKANRVLSEANQTAPPSSETPEPKSKKKRGVTDPTDELLDEIKSKKEIASISQKQKEQAEIIEVFIRKNPKVTTPAAPLKGAITPIDETLSSVLRKDVASETLVEILIEQGKIDMAVETLKKLIWKYPHKKTYFATKIQDLTGKGS